MVKEDTGMQGLAHIVGGRDSIDPIPIETRVLDQAQQTLYDLAEGNLVGRVVLEP